MSWENMNLRYYNCKFWWPNAEGPAKDSDRQHSILGQRRRYAPPALIGDLPDHTRHYPGWATGKRDDWCGEHAHRKCELKTT